MPVLHRYDVETDTAGSCALGRYDPTSSSECPRCNTVVVALPAMWKLRNKSSYQRVKLRMDCDSTGSSDAESSTGSPTDSNGASGSSDDDDTAYERGRVDISVQRLQSMHAVASNKSRSISKFARNGRSKSRIKDALENPPCKCRCKVGLQLLLRVCLTFWLLTKEGQDTVLWTIQTENPGSGTKKDWFIEGLDFENPCHLIQLFAMGWHQH